LALLANIWQARKTCQIQTLQLIYQRWIKVINNIATRRERELWCLELPSLRIPVRWSHDFYIDLLVFISTRRDRQAGRQAIRQNTKRVSITVPLTSCLTGLESAVWLMTIYVFICKTDLSKPVKQEVNGTVILPPLVFPACPFSIPWGRCR
jgi:hypothetical protein